MPLLLNQMPRRAASCKAMQFAQRGLLLLAVSLSSVLPFASAQSGSATHPWMNAQLSPDERASMVVKEMTLDEKIGLLHGTGMQGLSPMSPLAAQSNGGAGYVPGIPRLGIPGIQMSDAAYGVRNSGENGRYSSALPSDGRRPVGISMRPTNTEHSSAANCGRRATTCHWAGA
jgi:beta-glucosidase